MKLHNLILPEKVDFDKERVTNQYGRFVAEPFERGYGHTLGNSLRRVLLSSLEGAAVTAVKVPGAPHEYSVIRGVKEDLMEVILNLKRLRFKMYTSAPQILKLSVSKKSQVTAQDFETNSNIEIINSDVVVAHLDPGGKLDMEIEVSMGRGYLPAERNRRSDRSVDFIAVDALFSPITKVYYEVENARVGQITDYDRLVLDVWTDGSIAPLDAVTYAARILKESVAIFAPTDALASQEAMSSDSSAESADGQADDTLDKGVADLNLSVRALNCLKNAKINTLKELVQKSEEELLAYKNFGKVSLVEIKKKLEDMNLSLGMQI